MAISEIVDVLIDRQTTTPSRAGFGTLLIASEFDETGDATGFGRVQEYSGIEGVGEVFATTDPEYVAANAVFSQSQSPARIKIGRIDSADTTFTDGLNAIAGADDDWYALMLTSRDQTDQEDAAAWAESNDKLLGIASDAALDSGTAVYDTLQSNAYDRTWAFYHTAADGTANDPYPEAGLFGLLLSTDPGSATWWFKTIAGIPVDELSAGERSDAEDLGVMYYTRVAGVNITRGGTVGSGEYIDIMRGIDWLKARLSEDVFTLFVNVPKIPFTDAGIGSIESIVKERLSIAIDRGVLAANPEPVVTVPLANDVSTADKGSRLLRDVKWNGTLAGAVHKVEIRGVVTL